jgi:rRNA maturation endonuclease Nob1
MNRVDTGAVFKHPVHCSGCHEASYFTLRKIAGVEKLACPQCGSDIDLADQAYESLITWAKETTAAIDQIQNSAR